MSFGMMEYQICHKCQHCFLFVCLYPGTCGDLSISLTQCEIICGLYECVLHNSVLSCSTMHYYVFQGWECIQLRKKIYQVCHKIKILNQKAHRHFQPGSESRQNTGGVVQKWPPVSSDLNPSEHLHKDLRMRSKSGKRGQLALVIGNRSPARRNAEVISGKTIIFI